MNVKGYNVSVSPYAMTIIKDFMLPAYMEAKEEWLSGRTLTPELEFEWGEYFKSTIEWRKIS